MSSLFSDMLERRRSVRLLTLAFYVLHVIGHVNPTSTLHVKYQQQKAKSERAAGKLFQRSQQTCTSLDKSVHPDHPHLRHPRAAPGGDKFGKALYFSGNEVLKLKGPNSVNDYSTIPREAFTVEAWVKPEGGQDNPAVIMGVFDVCSMSSRDKGWSLGINSSEEDGERDARFYFRLRTDRARQASTIVAHYRYEPNKWLHLAASYNGHRMALYINSAKVGVSLEQKGSLFSRTSSKCKELEIGGDLAIRNFFRGNFDNFLLWSDSVPHRQIKNNMHNPTIPKGTKNLLMQDDFSNHDMWVTTNDKNVEVVLSDVPLQPLDLRLTAPPCGLTVCDNPEVVHSHAENWQLRVPKEVRYRVINVAEDDGRNPTVSREQIQYQHKKLNEAFQSYNISWSLTEVNIYNTSLRRTTIISDCEPSMVGNGVCNPDCKHEVTGNDGGDCDELEQQCQVEMVGDGTCDTSCNRVYHHWDGGDCCNPDTTETYRTCFDPSSPNKAYMSLREYKAILDFNSTTHLNLYFAAWTQEARLGIATFPWEKEVHGVYGGTVLQPENFGRPNVTDLMIHELGHNLGLWHVHHGVDEMDCSNECLETRPSMELGDLCADTHPTPMNNECKDPDYDQSKCGLAPFKHTPYNNFMSYADDSCTESFTPQQTARMHCYLDLAYHGWQVQKTLPAIVLPPKVLVVTSKTLSIGWLPPLTGELFGMSRDCGRCTRHKTLVQYGSTAYSPNPSKPKGYWGWTTSEATGPPDAESCIPSGKGWLPDVTMCNPCYIELGLDIPVVPSRLSVWVNWNAANGINNILLIYIDGTDTSLGSVNAYCDMPFTTKIKAYKKLKKIRIYTSSPYVSIDAVQVESSTAHPICEHCKKIKYKVRREPPFAIGEETAVDTTSFLDSDVQAGVMYKYWVSAAVGSVTSMPSPVLEYSFPDAFCGDGAIQGSEECDDANAIYGDGCDLDCQLEEFFHCEGEPSLCYLHDGDGVCEDFERRSSIQDCGFYTPQGFTDQWASEAMANPKYQNNACPENVIIGPPLRTQVRRRTEVVAILLACPPLQMCRPEVDPLTAWQPCSFSDGIDLYPLYWLRVTFPRPVVAVAVIIYLASDGITERSDEQKTVSVSLIDTEGREHDIASRQVPLSCKHNPVEVPVVHDLTAPFYHTKATKIKFISSNIAISAIALRSSNTLDPVAISRCQHGELYNPASQQFFKGEPSLCYLHDGDGVCEDFERRSSIQDCGFYTPQGFTDQWASEAMANPKYQNNACPENVIIGPPLRTQMCRPEVDPLTAWQPCSFSDGIDLYPLYWLRVTFPRPVVAVAVIIYLASDGITERSDEQKTVSVSLIDTEGREHDIASRQVPLSCKHNPVEVPVVHDLTAPFYHTKATKIKFISSNIAISAIALRSSNTLDPVAISRCQHGELYNPASQQCHAAMTCKKTTCPPLMVKYASVNSRTLKRDSLSNCSGMQDGDSCSVQCNRGYLPMGPRYVMCIKGRWNTEDLSCKPMDCREPNIPHASIVCKEGHSFGKKCTFKCKPPAKLQGDDNTIRCEEDGLWSLPQAFCQLICGPPPKQENANLATRRCLDSTNHHVGTSCKFRCKRGYHVVGTSSHSMPPYDRRVFRRSCSEEGLWEGPTCERVKCKSPPPMFKGLYNCTMGFDYQSKCTLRCGENDKMGTTITCQRDGNWDGAFKMCKNLKGDCPKIQSKDDVAFQCRGSSIGATCKAVCTSGGNIPIITRANDKMFQTPRSEDRRGPTSPHSWSYKSLANKFEKMAKSKMTMTTVKDVLLTCTGGLAWYPDPLDVGCVKECSEDFIDDGWCDQQNNRAFCNYDGGDCCESTNGNGKVQPFPANCKEECRCKDPNAIENRNGKGKDKSKGVLDPIWDRETNYSQEVSAEKLNEYSYNDKADDGFDYI
ncbi:pappalysin-1-like [Branchiostoma floridae]|uniref:Pappalysin-1-like n=1 Tax=Branchiostoma floridae TaxID=7739 RepID=A0A9J7MZD8_BRAFL|nr:pappalysin-1-like [Branchiostoma floridae]